MAAMVDLPVLLIVEPDLTKGIFEPSLVEHNVFRMSLPPDRSSPAFRSWLAAVGEHTTQA